MTIKELQKILTLLRPETKLNLDLNSIHKYNGDWYAIGIESNGNFSKAEDLFNKLEELPDNFVLFDDEKASFHTDVFVAYNGYGGVRLCQKELMALIVVAN